MGFKLPGKSVHSGTSAHSSALKMKAESNAAAKMKREAAAKMKMEAAAKMKKGSPMDKALVGKQNNLPEELKAKIEAAPGKMKPSPAKSKEYDAAAKRDPNLGKYVAERKKIKAKYGGDRAKYRASDEYKANQSKINKAYGIDDGYKAPKSTKTESKTFLGNVKKDEDAPRKEKRSESTKTNVKRRKDGTIKKETRKTTYSDEDGTAKGKEKATYRKDGTKKKIVVKEKDTGFEGEEKYRTKTKAKFDKEGDLKKTKEVEVKDGRRTVTKTKDGVTTTKSRRTLKGILTGKGKKKKEE